MTYIAHIGAAHKVYWGGNFALSDFTFRGRRHNSNLLIEGDRQNLYVVEEK